MSALEDAPASAAALQLARQWPDCTICRDRGLTSDGQTCVCMGVVVDEPPSRDARLREALMR